MYSLLVNQLCEHMKFNFNPPLCENCEVSIQTAEDANLSVVSFRLWYRNEKLRYRLGIRLYFGLKFVHRFLTLFPQHRSCICVLFYHSIIVDDFSGLCFFILYGDWGTRVLNILVRLAAVQGTVVKPAVQLCPLLIQVRHGISPIQLCSAWGWLSDF